MSENKYVERALAIRDIVSPHYNCAQAIMMSFSGLAGLTEEQACNIARFFGRGMKIGSTCGAITGGLMAVGMLGGGEAERLQFLSDIMDKHEGNSICDVLLRNNEEAGGTKNEFCNNIVAECCYEVCKIMHIE